MSTPQIIRETIETVLRAEINKEIENAFVNINDKREQIIRDAISSVVLSEDVNTLKDKIIVEVNKIV